MKKYFFSIAWVSEWMGGWKNKKTNWKSLVRLGQANHQPPTVANKLWGVIWPCASSKKSLIIPHCLGLGGKDSSNWYVIITLWFTVHVLYATKKYVLHKLSHLILTATLWGIIIILPINLVKKLKVTEANQFGNIPGKRVTTQLTIRTGIVLVMMGNASMILLAHQA